MEKKPVVVCPECGESVTLAELIIDQGSGVTPTGIACRLIPIHPPKEGCRISEIRDSRTSETIETECHGSLRPYRG